MLRKGLDFTFPIAIWQNFEIEVCLLNKRGVGKLSRQILLRSSKVICQRALNRLYQSGWNTNQN